MSLAGPTYHMEAYLTEGKIGETVKAAAEEFSRLLGYVKNPA